MVDYNILGPGSFADTGETTSRPAHVAPLETANDTWFEPCDPDTPNSGTIVNSVTLNWWLALFRRAIRTTGAKQILTVSGADDPDDMLGEAMTRSASAIWCTGAGTANAQVLTQAAGFVAPKSYFDKMTVRWYPAATNTGAATLAPFGLTAKSIVKVDGTALTGGEIRSPSEAVYDLVSDKFVLMPWSGTQFQFESARYRMSGTQTFTGGAGDFKLITNWTGTDPSFGSMSAGVFTLSRAGTYIFECTLTSDWANPFTINLQTDTSEVTALGYSVGGSSSGCSASVVVSKAAKGRAFKALAFFTGAGNPVVKTGNVYGAGGFIGTGYTQLTVSRIAD